MKERNSTIIDLRRNGHTLQEIGDRFNISRERVRQICRGVEFDFALITIKEIKDLYSTISGSKIQKWCSANLVRAGRNFRLDALKISKIPKMLASKSCQICGGPILLPNHWRNCSEECRIIADRKSHARSMWKSLQNRVEKRVCVGCYRVFEVNKYLDQRFHSLACYNNSRKLHRTEIQRLLSSGYSPQCIADKLGISIATVYRAKLDRSRA